MTLYRGFKCNDGHCEQCVSADSEHSEISGSKPLEDETYVEPDEDESLEIELSDITPNDDQMMEGTAGDEPAEDGTETAIEETDAAPEKTEKHTGTESKFPKNETLSETETTAGDKPAEIPQVDGAKQPIEAQRGDGGTKISKDGKCSKEVSCIGSGFGDCCSTSGYCGSGPKWCGMAPKYNDACPKWPLANA